MKFVFLSLALSSLSLFPALAKEPPSKSKQPSSPQAAQKQAVPYLGPGADKLSPQEYERIYKNYIQTSVLLGYPFLKQQAAPCDHALGALFRQAGMFSYPVPADAEVRRSSRIIGDRKVEVYESGAVIVQVVRWKSGALDEVVFLNSASPKASRRLSQIAKTQILELERDKVTGLERVKGIPVGYPHPFLTAEGQGLFVRTLKFNGKIETCEPLGFQDNSWVQGFDLSESRCLDLQADAENVWNEKLSPGDFSNRELKRMKDLALKSALAKGLKEEDAKKLVDSNFVPPFTNEINVVGSAMRNLAQCNLLALGRAGNVRGGGESEPSSPAGAPPAKGSGSAQ